MPGITLPETVSDNEYPAVKGSAGSGGRDVFEAANRRDLLQLELEGKRGDAAQDESEDEESESPAKATEDS
ncbi:hypothetical protein LBMAG56_06740 [Verrucomicrobiota bacterium]|nr:hypothetical protein LBMAG56_06740 [Verrucomicrobiota bacterium]